MNLPVSQAINHVQITIAWLRMTYPTSCFHLHKLQPIDQSPFIINKQSKERMLENDVSETTLTSKIQKKEMSDILPVRFCALHTYIVYIYSP